MATTESTSVVSVDAHPLLDLGAFVTHFSAPFGDSPEWLHALLAPEAEAPFHADDDVRAKVRDLLRHGGYKPTGRGKPASEFLLRGAPKINLAVDVANVVSLHSGLPVSVIDFDRAREPLSVRVAKVGEKYVFNRAGHEIDLEGLLCLYDADGPCANAVKDANRTKTSLETRRTLSLVWGTRALPGRTNETVAWYQKLLAQC